MKEPALSLMRWNQPSGIMRHLPSNIITLPLSTDSHHTQSQTQPYRWSGSDVCGWCSENQPSEIVRLSPADLIVSATLRRPSPHLISNTPVSVMKEWDIWQRRWKSTGSVHAHAPIWSRRLYHSRQTFTTLRLSLNKISTEGARYLTEALKMNRVSSDRCPHLISSFLLFSIDPDHTRPRRGGHGGRRGEICSWCGENQPSEFRQMLRSNLIISGVFHRPSPHLI